MSSRAARPSAKPNPGFEATCPTCGMTADVGTEAKHVRCKGCGTVIQLVDHAVPAVVSASAMTGAAQVDPGRVGLALAIGLAAPLLVGFAFGTAHTAVDRPEPDTGTAGFWYLTTILLAAGAVFALWPSLGSGRVFPRAAWALLSAVPMFVLAMTAGTAYDDDGMAWVILGMPLLVVYVLTVGITAAVLASRKDGTAAATVLVGGVGLCIGFGVAAMVMMMTLQEQADAARAAHEAPAWGLLAMLAVLFVGAAHRRGS